MELSRLLIGDNLEDLGEVLVRKRGRKNRHCLHERIGALTTVGVLRRDGDQNRTGNEPLHLVERARVRLGVDPAELMQDGDPDLGVRGNLVADRDPLQWRWASQRTVMPKEAGEQVPDARTRMHRIHPDIEGRWAAGLESMRVGDVQNLKVQVGTIGMQDELDDVRDLPPRVVLPVTAVVQARQAGDHHPVLLGAVDHPVRELGILSCLDIDLPLETTMTVFQVSHAIDVLPDSLLDAN